MLLVNVSNLDYVKVSNHGLFKIGRKDRPAEYEAVTSPIKVKLDKDLIVLLFAQFDEDHDCYKITYQPLYSTARKFKDEYIKEALMSKVKYDPERVLLKFVED